MDEMKVWWNITKTSLRCQKGQGMVEYGLILALVAVVAIVTMPAIGDNLATVFKNVAAKIK